MLSRDTVIVVTNVFGMDFIKDEESNGNERSHPSIPSIPTLAHASWSHEESTVQTAGESTMTMSSSETLPSSSNAVSYSSSVHSMSQN